MISVDSNLIFSAIEPGDVNHAAALQRLGTAGQEDTLVICPVVYAELMASAVRDFIRVFLQRAEIATLWAMHESVWKRAGTAFGDYASLRRSGSLPRRIVADFLIAAHAEHHELSVLTFDNTVFAGVFPDVQLV